MCKEIGNRIRILRSVAKLTQKELGEKIYLSDSMMSQVENGNREIALDYFVALCRALDTTPNILLGFDKLTIEL